MSRRQRARRQRVAAHFAARQAAAPDAAARAAVAFDHLRARLADLPAQERERAWQQAAEHLRRLADHLTSDHAT